MDIGDALFTLGGIVIGAGSQLIAPWITQRLSTNKDLAQEQRTDLKVRQDERFNRLVILRESTRIVVQRANDSLTAAHQSGIIHLRHLPYSLLDSRVRGMAFSFAGDYPNIRDRYMEFYALFTRLTSEIVAVRTAARRRAVIYPVDTSWRRRKLSDLDSLYSELDAKREEFKGELLAAAEDLGYEML